MNSGGESCLEAPKPCTDYSETTEQDARKSTQLRLTTAAACLPHPKKVHYGGEDAYFISTAGGGALGVADGVGSWISSGVNPAEYSCKLMHLACAFLEGTDSFAPTPDDGNVTLPRIDPQGALNAAHLNTKIAGSATACVIQLDVKRGTLEAANLGDSGFVLFRGDQVVAKSRPQQHHFDCPYQFQACPEFVDVTDTADMAEMHSVAVEAGDIIIAASDGLWDNCFEHELLALLPPAASAVQDSANRIAAMARAHAEDADFPSPYTREATKNGFNIPIWDRLIGATCAGGRLQLKGLTGGKIDDITVLVAVVEEIQVL